MLKILTHRAKLTRQGTVRVRLRCLWTRPCTGALVIFSNQRLDAAGRYGGGDFTVAGGRTGTAEVALRGPARRLVKRGGRLETGTYVHLKGFGGEKLYAGGGLLTIRR